MATNFNVSPYFDDFSEAKNFHRVLFRPAFAVQARELTQLQTILQNQLERFGEHVFKDGSMVIPGEVTINTKYEFVKLASHSTATVANMQGLTVTGSTSGIVATVVNTAEATSTSAATIYVSYTSTGTDTTTKRFTEGETLTFTFNSTSSTAVVGTSGTSLPTTSNATGFASSVNVQAGVYFINGFFVSNSEETLILDAYSNTPSYRVGFNVTESFVTPEDDSSINDNAAGSSNVNAPGAHRFKVALTLSKKLTTDSDDENFVELLRVKSGVVESIIQRTDYNILEETLARRTADESGDYVIKAFDIDVREHKNDGSNRGIFSADSSSLHDGLSSENSEKRLAVGLSPGKAYVKGYEVETTGQKFVTIEKARDFDTIQNSTTRLDIGNSINVTNIHGQPDLGTVSGETEAFKELSLLKKATASRGTANVGSSTTLHTIGRAKPRYFEYVSGTAGATSSNTTSVYKLGLFNVDMFTHIVTTGSFTLKAGEVLTGSTSGATGIIEATSVAAGLYILSNVKGTFQVGEAVVNESSNSATIAANAATRNAIQTYTLNDVKQVSQAGSPVFTADTVLSSSATDTKDDTFKTLTGVMTVANSADAVKGQGTKFTEELITGDLIQFTDNTGETLTAVVDEINSDTTLTLLAAVGGADVTTASPIIRRRTRLNNVDTASLVYKLPEQVIKTLKTTDNAGITDTSHKVRRMFVDTLSSTGVATFSAGANETFDSHSEADFTLQIMTAGASSGAVGDLVSLSGNNHEGDAIFTLTGSPSGRQLQIDLGANFRTAKVKLTATITKSVANEKTKALVTGETATTTTQALSEESVISLGKADIFELTSVHMAADFSTDATTSDTDITDRFTLDNGQRDSFYDIGTIVRKPGSQTPTGRLLITFSHFTHGTGNYFSVDSYSGVVDYSDIPSFESPTKGKIELRDALDFRPRVADDSEVVGFNDKDATGAKNFANAGASTVDIPKPGSDATLDFEFHLSRIDGIFITKDGQFKQAKGTPAIDPQRPEPIDDAVALYYLNLPPFTFSTDDVDVTVVDNRRYTMRDIGKLEQRIKNIEYYTQLSLLEQQAINTQIQDATTGLDRFKNGIVVDSFKGHNVGDTGSAEYRCSIDMDEGELRAEHHTDQVKLVELAANDTDAERTTAGYQKTGDLITLPYTSAELTKNPYATKSVNCNPFLVFQYQGDIALTPDVDEWYDTTRRPDLIVNDNNLFDTMTSLAGGSNNLGTVWNNWQTNWSGRWSSTGSTRVRGGTQTTTVSGDTQTRTRTGITREIAGNNVIRQSFGDRIVDVAFIPFIRTSTITFTATRMKPNTKVFPFFDNVAVTSHVTPDGGVLGGNLVTNSVGSVTGTFTIPNTATERFRTGDRIFRLTSSSTNATDDDSVDTFAQATYSARGLQTTTQETIQSTRVPIIRTRSVSEQEERRTTDNFSLNSSFTPDNPNPDPLAQTFSVDAKEGVFITKVDLFFEEKDDTIPIKVYMTETINSRPGRRIIPFSEVTVQSSSVNTSTDASSATTVTFPSPVYLQGGKEYAIVLKPDSQKYKAWVSRLGDTDVGGTRRVTQQPLFGSLFRSQNAKLWTEDQMEDLKITIHKAAFTTGTTGTLKLTNDTVPSKTLANNPIQTDSSSGSGSTFGGNPNIIKINHPHHGMNDSKPSKVTISGLGATTDFNGIQGSVINGTHDVGNVTEDSYTVTLSGDPATSTGSVGGSTVVATQDRAFEAIMPKIGIMIFPDTTSEHSIKTTSTTSVHGSETSYSTESSFTNIVPNENFYFTSARTIASAINETTHLSGNKSLFYNITLSSTNANLSPVIDLARTNVFAIHNRLDSPTNSNTTGFIAETDPTGGSASAKYITKEITLQNPSTSLDVRLAASIFPTSSIEVFRKVKSDGDEREMKDIPYVQMTQSNTAVNAEGRSQSPYNINFKTDFFDYEYGETDISEFVSFKIKIVMKGTNPAYPPRLTDLRAIALAI
tara:strand:+ start:8074 stop:13980 length:5907 start_codon:yes stop_codon:yes gene_type:complete